MKNKRKTGRKPKKGICVDGSTLINPGPSEYQGRDLSNKKIVLNYNLGIATNNIAEFVAVVHAIKLCLIDGYPSMSIYSDSTTAMSWISRGFANTKMNNCPKKLILILDRSKELLSGYDIAIVSTDKIQVTDPNTGNKVYVKRWYTKQWGENPADFGRK